MQYENQQVQTRLGEAEDELRRTARDANVSQVESRAVVMELQSKVESLQARATWFQGLLSERERLQDVAEEQCRSADAKQAECWQLLSEASGDLRQAKDYILELQQQLKKVRECQGDTAEQATSPHSFSPQLSASSQHEKGSWEQETAQQDWVQGHGVKLQMHRTVQRLSCPQAKQHLPSTSQHLTQQHLTSMTSPELQDHIEHLQQHLQQQLQRDKRQHLDSSRGGTHDEAQEAVVIQGLEERIDENPYAAETGMQHTQEMAKAKEQSDAEAEHLRSVIVTMEVTLKQQVGHLVKSKEREFQLSSDLLEADKKVQNAQEEKKSALVQLEAVLKNLQQLKNELEVFKGRESINATVHDEMIVLEKRSMQRKLEHMNIEYVSLQASHESQVRELRKSFGNASFEVEGHTHTHMGPASPRPSSPPASTSVGTWPKSVRPPGVFSDYSPFIANNEESAEATRLKVRELSERLQETENTLEEGKRDMIQLLKQAAHKDQQIQELLAASFRQNSHSSHSSPMLLPATHTLTRSHAPPPYFANPATNKPHVLALAATPAVIEPPSATPLRNCISNQYPASAAHTRTNTHTHAHHSGTVSNSVNEAPSQTDCLPSHGHDDNHNVNVAYHFLHRDSTREGVGCHARDQYELSFLSAASGPRLVTVADPRTAPTQFTLDDSLSPPTRFTFNNEGSGVAAAEDWAAAWAAEPILQPSLYESMNSAPRNESILSPPSSPKSSSAAIFHGNHSHPDDLYSTLGNR